jgi:hypothetical protein
MDANHGSTRILVNGSTTETHATSAPQAVGHLVVLVPYDDDDPERLVIGRSPRFEELLNRSRLSIRDGKGRGK